MSRTNHIVNRIAVNTTGVSTERAFKWRAQVSDYLNYEFPHQLQAILDEVYMPQEQVVIDRLEINITVSDGERTDILQRELLQALKKELKHQKQEAILIREQEQTGTGTASLNRQADAWLFYLQNGFYPWYQQQILTQQQIETLIQSQAALVAIRLPIVLYTLQAQQRFFMMMSAPLINALIPYFVNTTKQEDAFISSISLRLQRPKEIIVPIVKRTFLKLVISGQQSTMEQFFEQVKEMSNGAFLEKGGEPFFEKAPDPKPEEQLQRKTGIAQQEAIWIQNAGLVLVHPFLAVLFERRAILNEQKQISNLPKALALIHYLLYSGSEYADASMILPKILCGIDYNEVIAIDPVINTLEKEECKELLLSVIEYWDALKKTSEEGLLETFIRRKGKLLKKDSNWLLQVENRTEDILLDRLPWSIGFIKLPWMTNPLTTEWR